jgi:RNA polymerase sigma-70 factor (ECF subfamily)
MPTSTQSDSLLVEAIRRGKPEAWTDLIAQYEGRLLSFVDSRLRRRSASEDVVQETFIGFLTSLPNYDPRRPLESWLFTIASHKLTDYLRREGRRPAIPLSSADGSSGAWEPTGQERGASSIARSGERRTLEEEALAEALTRQLDAWREAGDWEKLKCMELLFVVGESNKATAEMLGITEQQVANFKFDFIERLRKFLKQQRLSEDVFPELS